MVFFVNTACVYTCLVFVIASICSTLLAFSWHFKFHFKRRNPLFWHFKSNKRTKKEKLGMTFLIFFKVFARFFQFFLNKISEKDLPQPSPAKSLNFNDCSFCVISNFLLFDLSNLNLRESPFSVITLKRRFLKMS